MANENSIDVYHALMALEEKVTGTAPDPENVATDVACALADIFRTDAPMAQETAIVHAIDTVTANYGGGGGADVGPLAFVGGTEEAPIVGGEMFTYSNIALVKIGDVAIYDGSPYGAVANGGFAAGLTLTTDVVPATGADTMYAYVCTVDASYQYTTVELWDGTLTRENAEYEGDPGYKWTFTMPELQQGERLLLYPHTAE